MAKALAPVSFGKERRSVYLGCCDTCKKHHRLQLKKHDRINGWSASHRVGLAYQVVDKREIQNLVQSAIKVILGNELLQGDRDQWRKRPLFEIHHACCSSSPPIALQPHLPCQSHLSPFSSIFSFSSFIFSTQIVAPSSS